MDDIKNRGTARVGHHVLAGALAAAAAIGCASAVAATTDAFLKIGDIKGESTDDKHRGEIDVLAWSWGVNGAAAGDSKKTAVPACGQPLVIDKKIDRSTPLLVTGAATSTVYPSATLAVRKAGAEPLEFLSVILSGVSVKSTLTGAPDADGGVSDHLVLGYASARIEYRPQKADGTLDAAVVGTAPASCP
jgi:type VI secretion system secreted protein Hcp